MFVGALVRLIIAADATLMKSTAGVKIVCGSDCGYARRGQRRADAFVASRVPPPDFVVKLRVEHVGFETPPHVAFAAEHRQRGQPLLLFAMPNYRRRFCEP